MTKLTIETLGQHGEGVAEFKGQRVYVPFTLPGEIADVDIVGERATLVSLRAESAERVAPVCTYFGTCGGCSLQHLGPGAYATFKRGLIEMALSHVNIEVPVGPLLLAHGNGRRRTTLHARKAASGYMRARSHDVLDIAACPILVPALKNVAPRIANDIHAIIGDCDVAMTATATGIDVAIKTEKSLKGQKLVPLAQRLKLARLSLNGELHLQAQPPSIRMGKALVEIPINGFLQATEAAEQTLANLVVAAAGKAKAVADLFCGVGPFTFRLAETARVHAADSDALSIAALQNGVRHTQGLKPITSQKRDLFRDPLAPAELAGFDAVVFDPPRAGAEAQAKELARSRVKTVIAVSCDPKTFARDAAILIAGGYRLESVTPVDQFAWSTHVEIVGVFRR